MQVRGIVSLDSSWSGNRRRSWPHDLWRGALLAQRARLGEVHRGSCSEDIHMEEEKVEVKVQEAEVEDRENARKRAKWGSKRENKQSLRRMTHGWDDAHQHLSQCGITHHYACALWTRKNDVWSVLFTHPVGCSRLLSPGKRTYYSIKQKIILMSSTSFYPTASMKNLEEEDECHLCTVEKELLLIHCGDGSLLWLRLGSLIEVSIGAFLPDLLTEIYQCFLHFSYSSDDGQ